ncbi:unnamed protein product [Blepharisma stoltei]|uniref:Uncharacterized protein n=1 Tax=Blepharisma stoltei TaxID=1481888 RepID=A0AAU9JJD0_9CILI|nr:unnamed protein product [Blepharisma stoltei]
MEISGFKAYILILSACGSVYLLGLGIALCTDYEYVEIKNKFKGGIACIIASLVYGSVVAFWAVQKYKSRRRKPKRNYRVNTEAEGIQLLPLRSN